MRIERRRQEWRKIREREVGRGLNQEMGWSKNDREKDKTEEMKERKIDNQKTKKIRRGIKIDRKKL